MMKYSQGRRKFNTRGCKNKSLGHFELAVGSIVRLSASTVVQRTGRLDR